MVHAHKEWLVLALALVGCASGRAARHAGEIDRLTHLQLIEVGDALAQSGDTVRAAQYYATALREGGDRSRVLPPLLRLYVRDGQYRLAVELAEDQLRRAPEDVRLRLLLGTLHAAAGQLREAVSDFEHVLRRAPDSAAAHYALASVLHDGQIDRGRADEHFRAYLSCAPDGEHAAEARSLLLSEVP